MPTGLQNQPQHDRIPETPEDCREIAAAEVPLDVAVGDPTRAEPRTAETALFMDAERQLPVEPSTLMKVGGLTGSRGA